MRIFGLTVLLCLGASWFRAVAEAADSNASFTLPSGVLVTIIEAPFKKANFKIVGCNGHDACFINGHVSFGVLEKIPKTYVKSISVSFKGRSFELDASDMYDAWRGRPLEVKGVRYFGGQCATVNYCQFRGLFSDAAGSFVAEWVVVEGKPFRTPRGGRFPSHFSIADNI